MIRNISFNLLALLLTLCVLTHCSFDPKLDVLKLRVTVEDSNEQESAGRGTRHGTLASYHHCKIVFTDPIQQLPDSACSAVSAANGKGSVSMQLPITIPYITQIPFELLCGPTSSRPPGLDCGDVEHICYGYFLLNANSKDIRLQFPPAMSESCFLR